MLKNLTRAFLVIVSASLLMSCTQKFSDVNATMQEAMFGRSDVELTTEDISDIPYASMYVRINDGGKVLMVLALAEENQITGETRLKWMSTDRGVIITEQGRIVKTIALPNTNLTALHHDSPHFQYEGSAPPSWTSAYDWQPDYRFGYEAISNRKYLEMESVNSPLWTKQTQKIEENTHFDVLNSSLTNTFWIDEKNRVVKSIQYIGPDMTKIETLLLKGYKN